MATDEALDPDELVCAICMDPYKDPRFLPSCHHTFCATCIQNLSAKHNGGDFPCPCCRKTSRLPPGGTRDLQINFYINNRKKLKTTETNVPPDQLMCPVHEEEKFRFHCTQCQQVICRDCKLTQHEGHPTEDLKAAEARIKNKIVIEKIVNCKLKQYNDNLNVVQRRSDDVFQKKAAVEKSIRDRHATLVAAADKARDEALESLNTVAANVGDDYKLQMHNYTTSNKFQSARYIQRKLNDVSSKSSVQLVEVAKAMNINLEMDNNELQRQFEDKFPDDADKGVVRSVTHRFQDDDTVKMAVQMAREFMGSVVKTEVPASPPDVTVVERFTCAADGDYNIRIFNVCNDDETVWVSYDHCGLDDNVVVKLFDETGRFIMTESDSGKVTYKRCDKGMAMGPIQKKGCLYTYTKSLTAGHFRLNNDFSGKADVWNTKVVSSDPFKTEGNIEFQIKVGGHRAVDVDDTEQLFVVVVEPQAPDGKRRVQLYQRGKEDAVTTYQSPVQPFQPSDVCFYTVGGQRRLLVADEANDSIHVVKVSSDSLTFDRYLVPGCPCLVQPTALNVDTKGRLWVACRGGKIITMENKV